MNFSNLYPFNRNKILMERLAKDPKFKAVEKRLFADTAEVDQLFEHLRKIENKEKDLAENSTEIIAKCNEILSKQAVLSSKNPLAKVISLAIQAVKMEVYTTLNQSEEIRKNYSNFRKAITEIDNLKQSLPRDLLPYLSSAVLEYCYKAANNLASHLNPVIKIKEGTSLNQVTVPDALVLASVATQDEFNKTNIRRIFHELWEIESLRPLLTIAAYSVHGHYIYEGKSQSKDPFKIIFSHDSLDGHSSGGITRGLTSSDNIIVSLAEKSAHGLEVVRSNANIRGTIAHELHHGWEKLRYFQHSSLPYTEKQNVSPQKPATFFQRHFSSSSKIAPFDPNKKTKERLNKMLQEAKDLKLTHSIRIANALDDNFLTSKRTFLTSNSETKELENEQDTYPAFGSPQPFQIFNALKSYSRNERTQHAEIVVRVSNSLGTMVGEGGCLEAQAFEIMRKSGLTECLNFFEEEKQQMEILAKELAEKTGITFAATQKSRDIPEYLNYSSTALHDAVRSGDRELISRLIKENPASLKDQDSLGQTAFELALDLNNPTAVFAFSKSPEMQQELAQNPRLFRRTIFYLIHTTKDANSPHSEEAAALFKEARNKAGYLSQLPPVISNIFYDAENATLDKN